MPVVSLFSKVLVEGQIPKGAGALPKQPLIWCKGSTAISRWRVDRFESCRGCEEQWIKINILPNSQNI